LLNTIKERGYRFARFDEIPNGNHSAMPIMLLRHDIDIDLGKASRMATIEQEEGAVATYFFMVRTQHYNLFSREGTTEVEHVLNAGHHFGLHFDCAAYPENETVEQLNEMCNKESEMLEHWFGKPVTIVSYHRPEQIILTGNPALSAPRPHTYMDRFTKDIFYLSDSRGRWTHGTPLECDALKNRKPMQLLTHPIWWDDVPLPPLETLQAFVARHKDGVEMSLAQNNTVYRVGKYSDVQG